MTARTDALVAATLKRFHEKAAGAAADALIYLHVRRGGRRGREAWVALPYGAATFARMAHEAFAESDGALEATLHYDAQPLRGDAQAWAMSNETRGLIGFGVRIDDRLRVTAPNQTIASNRAPRRELARLRGLDPNTRLALPGPLTVFETDQLLLSADFAEGWRSLERARRARGRSHLDADGFTRFWRGLAGWLAAQTDQTGALTYKYWPSRGEVAPSDNTIRQFLGTLALGRAAARLQCELARDVAARNLKAACAAYLQDRDDHAVAFWGGSAKLGAAALAALALYESGDERLRTRWLEKLSAGVDRLWSPSGAFRTFHEPLDRNDNQNFYPGEALVFWAARLASSPAIADRIARSFDYYRDWHRANPNPAFAPWHTIAYAALYAATGEARYRDFIFEMNDWIVSLQQLDDAPAADMRGRFYAPERPDYGPPHSSSTAVYLEGLVAAADVADAAGDRRRLRRYARAIAEGFANLESLQFMTLEDYFYVSKRDRVIGGLRTEGYDNTLRVDNAAHALLAALSLMDRPNVRRAAGLS